MMVKLALGVLLAGLLIAPCAFAATDYSTMTDEQLQQQRTTVMSTGTPEEQQAFSQEWYKRYQRQPIEEQMRMREQKYGLPPGETTGEAARQPLPGQQQSK